MLRPLLMIIILFTGCVKSFTGKTLASDVCDCYKVAGKIILSDPTREKARADCEARKEKAFNMIKDNKKYKEDFNSGIADCTK